MTIRTLVNKEWPGIVLTTIGVSILIVLLYSVTDNKYQIRLNRRHLIEIRKSIEKTKNQHEKTGQRSLNGIDK